MAFVYKYPHPAVTTDCVILTFHEGRLKILLIRRGIEPYKGFWALPGGFLRMDESAEEGALRELQEETGVTGCHIKQFHTFSAPGRDPRERVITIAFYALMKWRQATGADDADLADWIPVDELPPLAFDHDEIIKLALETIRKDIFFEPVGFELLDEVFSMSELQKVYESILGREFDRRNFAKKMKHLDILQSVEEGLESNSCKPEIREESGKKSYPLPFLNESSAPVACADTADVICEDCSVELDELSENKSCSELCDRFSDDFLSFSSSVFPQEDESSQLHEKKKHIRRGVFFRLNRKKYNSLKDDNTIEF